MSYRVVILPTAQRRVLAAAEWYRKTSGSRAVAERWTACFENAVESLRGDPMRYSLAPESEEAPRAIREMRFGSGRKATHRILFAVEGQTILILTVRHFAQSDFLPGEF